ncbi:MAG: threonine/serine exporter family protein [Butyrivibrio sp.]
MQNTITIVSACIGTIGFSLIYNIRKRHLIPGFVNTVIVVSLYVILSGRIDNLLVLNTFLSVIAALLSELEARLFKAPVTVFLIPAIFPLVPGGYLYYTMYAIITQNSAAVNTNASAALMTSLGLATGIVMVSLIFSFIRKRR